MNNIRIGKPYITYNEDGSLCKYNVEINENGKIYNLFSEVEIEYEKYICIERSDAALYLVLPAALREGCDIYCEAPVTEQFLHNICEIMIPQLSLGDSRIRPINIYAPMEGEAIGGNAVGTAMSCGVDSFYTTMKYTDCNKYPDLQLTHLFISSSNAELWNTQDGDLYKWENEHPDAFKRFYNVAEMLNLPLVKMYSNFVWYLLKHDWKMYHHLYVHDNITMANVLVLKKLWKTYFFSSAYDFTYFSLKDNLTKESSDHDLLSAHVLTVPDLTCYSGGAEADRVEKTRHILSWEPVRKNFHPCHKGGEKNCSEPTCGKCVRAFLAADCYGMIDQLRDTFDVDKYLREKRKFLWWLVEFTKSSPNDYGGLYNLCYEKFPEEMDDAVKRNERDTSPTVSRKSYNALNKAYSISLNLLSLNEPKKFLLNFFASRGVKKLYCTGPTFLGNKIVSLIEKEIHCYSFQNSKVSDCDAAFITQSSSDDIKSITSMLYQRGAKQIITINDLNNEIKNQTGNPV